MTFTSMSNADAGEATQRPIRGWHLVLILVGLVVAAVIVSVIVKAEDDSHARDFASQYHPDYARYDADLTQALGTSFLSQVADAQALATSTHHAGDAYCRDLYDNTSESHTHATFIADTKAVTGRMSSAQVATLYAAVGSAARAELCP